MRRILIAAALFGLIAPEGALAQGQRPWVVCQIKTICAGVQPGGGRIIDCLREHKDQLSDACYAALGRQMINRPPRPAAAMKAPPAANAGAAPAAPAASAGAAPAAGGMDLDAAPPADDLGGQEPAPQ
jgi:hypothetical protein